MESFDSSPNYMKATSSFDSKKEYFPGGSECDDMFSTTNSTCGSSVNGPYYAPKLNNNNGGIEHKTIKNKTMKNFGNVKSFRRRAKSRTIHQSPFAVSGVDSSESSPHYLKSTSSSQGKKTKSLDRNKSLQTISRASSLRNVRILIKKTGFKPKKSLSNDSNVFEDVVVTRATFSSTLKDSKFLQSVEVRSRWAKTEKNSGSEVCRYHHCSLHGHCQGPHDPVSQTKRFLYKRRRSFKKQEIVPKTEPPPGGEKRNSFKEKNIRKSRIIDPIAEQLNPCEGNYRQLEKDSDFIEVAFGEMSFPERSYKENLDISIKYSLLEQELSNGYCLNDDIPQIGFIDVVKKPNERVTTLSRSNVESDTDFTEKPIPFEITTGKNVELLSASSDDNKERATKSTPAEDSHVDINKITENNDLPTEEVNKLQLSKPRHVSMWNLIHQHMSLSNVVVGPTNEPFESTSSCGDSSDPDMGTMSNDSEESQEIELRKMFAIKIVREAIEKILLPEVQDQTSDDQSVTSESSSIIEVVGSNQIEEKIEEKFAESVFADKDDGNPKQSSLINDHTCDLESTKQSNKEIATRSETKAPKHWSNLKKWILLQRFIGQLEKVKKFNPKKPKISSLNPDTGTEKVNLRNQTIDARKNAEEWMLDYAIRQAVGQLAPTQKRKVALLVKAFETVAPTKEDDPKVQCRSPRAKSGENNMAENQESGVMTSKKNQKHSNDDHGDLVPSNGRSKLEDPDSEKDAVKLGKIVVDETERKSSPKPQENATLNPLKGKTACIQTDNEKHIKMWHKVYRHVVSGIATKVGSRLLDGGEDDEVEDNNISPYDGVSSEKNHVPNGFTKSDALKLVKEAVDEILLSEIQDDSSSDTQSVASELSISDQDISERNCNEIEVSKSKNWSKLRRLILLKKSITALETARKLERREGEKINPRIQIMDERKRAEEWMVDYAIRHIVTKLTPARKKRVSMLVEAFEAVVPLPGM